MLRHTAHHPDPPGGSSSESAEQQLRELDAQWEREQQAHMYHDPIVRSRQFVNYPQPAELPSIARVLWGVVSLLLAYGMGLLGLAFFIRRGGLAEVAGMIFVGIYGMVVTIWFGIHIILTGRRYMLYRLALERYRLRRTRLEDQIRGSAETAHPQSRLRLVHNLAVLGFAGGRI